MNPTRPTTHLCLVSNQPVPSLAPLIDPALGVKRVLLAATPDRRQHAEWLEKALDYYQINAEILPLKNGYSLPLLLSELALLRERNPQGLAVNLTGGTKLMTIAAWEQFRRPQDTLYYINIHDDTIDWLHPEGQLPHPIADRLRIEPYLAAYGAYVRREDPPLRDPLPPQRHSVYRELMTNLTLRQHLQLLRAKAQGDAMAASRDIYRAVKGDAGMAQIVNYLHKHALIPPEGSPLSDDFRAFIHGGWLEEAIFTEVMRHAESDKKIHDVVRNLRFLRGGSPKDALINEIDVAFLRDNTLHLIECKTGKTSSQTSGMSFGEQFIHKLDHIRDAIGGLRSRLMIVTQQSMNDTQRKRAEEIGVTLIENHQIGDFSRHLTNWINRRHTI